jgi:hypothetical protein
MAPKKSRLKTLSRKPVSPKKAAAVKGGARKNGKLSANHNQTVR